MEETELEEGEACYYKDDASIDPDIAFSYIDEKLQNVLGHFQKDFEVGVSAENLGAKFGGYGSFLPTYQRSPSVWSQPKTPLRVQNYSTPRSPNDSHSEGAPQNFTVPSDVPPSVRPGTASRSMHFLNDPKVASADDSARNDSCLLPVQVAEKFPLKHNPSVSKSVNPTDQRSLKVRIKVDSDNMRRKNAAIYSGLGLTSPYSSTENSSEESGCMPAESQEAPYESPGSILHNMTSFPVPGGLLLSPLHESLLCLRKEMFSFERKFALPIKGWQKNSSIFVDGSASVPGDGEMSKGEKTKSVGKNDTQDELKHGNGLDFEDNINPLMKKSKETETLKSKKCLSNDLKIKLLSNSVHDSGNSLKAAVRESDAHGEAEKHVPVKKREIKKDWMRDRFLSTCNASKESLESIYGQGFGKYEKKETKSSSMEQLEAHRVRVSLKDSSVGLREGGNIKGNRVPSVSKVNSDCKRDAITATINHIEKKVGPKSTAHEVDEITRHHSIGTLAIEGKKKSKGSQSNGNSADNLMEESLRSGVRAARTIRKGVGKDVRKVSDSYKDDTRLEYMDNQMKSLERPAGDRAKDHNLEAVKEKEAQNAVSSPESPPPLEMAPATKIVEDWVCCDHCQKWRLLPYGTKAEQLPEKWMCSMLNWLPGMNRCDISEDDTNNLQKHDDRAASRLTLADFGLFNQNQNLNSVGMPIRGKKKHKLKPAGNSSGLVRTSNLTKDLQEETVKRKSLYDMNQPLLETNLMKNSNALHPSKSCNSIVERTAAKQNEKLVNGGAMKHKKLNSKRKPDQHVHETLKKIKTEATPDTDKREPKQYGHGSSRSALQTREGGKDMQKHSEQRYSKDGNHMPIDRFIISVKRQRDNSQVSLKNGRLDMKTCDETEMHAKNKKSKDWQDNQTYLEARGSNGNHLPGSKIKEESSYRKLRKQKKSRILNTESKESITSKDDLRKCTVTKIILSGSRGNSVERSCEKDQQPSKHRENVPSQPLISCKPALLQESETFEDKLALVRRPLSRFAEGTGFDVQPIDGFGDRDELKVMEHPGKAVHPNGTRNSVRNLVPDHCMVKDLSLPSPVKEDTSSRTATNALKEAEELKAYAHRLQNTGFDFECNEACFQAALKFLHCASLLEDCSIEKSKQGEMDQMQICSTAAKLCETCAHEYEKCKEMAAAALAYKCMEVAYLKLVYCKSSSTNKDRHDLQACLQMVPQGESPSSSASDVDNLNNHAMMEKAALSRGIAHAGNCVIVARNCSTFARLLDFTNDVNSAMEASRKSQNTYAAATVILEEAQNKEGVISVKRVIDFSFQDVKELVCLVRHASEAISRQGFGGNRE